MDDRRVISGIPHVLRSGCRWKDCPLNRIACRRRSVIERVFCSMTDRRRVATRYDRLARGFLSAVAIVATACLRLS